MLCGACIQDIPTHTERERDIHLLSVVLAAVLRYTSETEQHNILSHRVPVIWTHTRTQTRTHQHMHTLPLFHARYKLLLKFRKCMKMNFNSKSFFLISSSSE